MFFIFSLLLTLPRNVWMKQKLTFSNSIAKASSSFNHQINFGLAKAQSYDCGGIVSRLLYFNTSNLFLNLSPA